MKKWFMGFAIIFVFGFTAFLIGCSTTTTTTTATTTTAAPTTTAASAATTTGAPTTTAAAATTTTTTATTTTKVSVSAAEVNAAKIAGLLASGTSNMGNVAKSVGSSAQVGASSASLFSIRAFQPQGSGPPTSFFTENMITGSASLDGFILASTDEVGGFITPYIRMFTQAGDLIAGSTLLNKKIASLEVTLQQMMTGGVSEAATGYAITNFVTVATQSANPYSDSSLFIDIATTGDYMGWAFMFPMMGAYSPILLATPEATTGDKIGTMETKMVFGSGLSGEAVGAIGVVGPTRMSYARSVSTVNYLASVLSGLVAELYGRQTPKKGRAHGVN